MEYLEPAKIAILKYANSGNDIPELDLFTNSIERVFRIWKVFDDDYEGDQLCKGYIFSRECTRIIFKFGSDQMEAKQKAELSEAKKAARAERRQTRKQGKDTRSDRLRKQVDDEDDDDDE